MGEVTPPDRATLILDDPRCRIYHATWRQLHELLTESGERPDCGIFDTPYSDATHSGHEIDTSNDGCERRPINYACWSDAEVNAFCDAWMPLIKGWCVSQTDDQLFPVWRAAARRLGRYVFANVPTVIEGMTVRITGDGPSCWSIANSISIPAISNSVSRPSTIEYARWGTLPGAYVGKREKQAVVGGKPVWLLERIVADYSRRGDVLIDPCCGGGTMGVAAIRAQRNVIMGDQSLEHAEIAKTRCLRELAKIDGPAVAFSATAPPAKYKQSSLDI